MSQNHRIPLAEVWNFPPPLVRKLNRAGFATLQGVSRVRFSTLLRKVPKLNSSEFGYVRIALREYGLPCRQEDYIWLPSERAMRCLWRHGIYRYGQVAPLSHERLRNVFNPSRREREATEFADTVAEHMRARGYVQRPATSEELEEARKAAAEQAWRELYPDLPARFIELAWQRGIQVSATGLHWPLRRRASKDEIRTRQYLLWRIGEYEPP